MRKACPTSGNSSRNRPRRRLLRRRSKGSAQSGDDDGKSQEPQTGTPEAGAGSCKGVLPQKAGAKPAAAGGPNRGVPASKAGAKRVADDGKSKGAPASKAGAGTEEQIARPSKGSAQSVGDDGNCQGVPVSKAAAKSVADDSKCKGVPASKACAKRVADGGKCKEVPASKTCGKTEEQIPRPQEQVSENSAGKPAQKKRKSGGVEEANGSEAGAEEAGQKRRKSAECTAVALPEAGAASGEAAEGDDKTANDEGPPSVVYDKPPPRAFGDAYKAVQEARRALNAPHIGQAAVFVTAATTSVRRVMSLIHQGLAPEGNEILANLETARLEITKLRTRPSKQTVIEAMIALDGAYHHLYYLASIIGVGRQALPPPHAHFRDVAKVASDETMEEFVKACGPVGAGAARQMLGLTEQGTCLVASSSQLNPLLALMQLRWKESLARVAANGLVPTSPAECSEAPPSKRGQQLTMRRRDPVAGQLVRQWRDSIRVWACHLYAYAVPNKQALGALSRLGPLVEIGAGTGYWAYLLRRRHVTVEAYDINPPLAPGAPIPAASRGTAGDASSNEYHGLCRAWTPVRKGGPEVLANHRSESLFLCYPPPGSTMAEDAVRAYKGDVVCLVGEWNGDTATASFQRLLAREFALEETIDLPNWGDSLAQLTVWRRRVKAAKQEEPDLATVSPLACWGCGKRGDKDLQRCRLTFDAVYCSSACAAAPEVQARHRAQLALRLTVLPRPKSWRDVADGATRFPGASEIPVPVFGDRAHFRPPAPQR